MTRGLLSLDAGDSNHCADVVLHEPARARTPVLPVTDVSSSCASSGVHGRRDVQGKLVNLNMSSHRFHMILRSLGTGGEFDAQLYR